jgi:phosphonoacetaldehyde hydrolase
MHFETPESTRGPYVGPLRAVIFDWAGTVVDYGSRAPVLAVMRTFEAADVPLTVEEARGPMGMAKRDHLRAVMALPRVRSRWEEVHGSPPNEGAVDRLYASFLETQSQLLVQHSQLIPGCLETVAECRRRGMKVGSTTGYTRELMDILEPAVHKQGFRPDAMVCASDVPEGRPAPWMCFESARRLNVYPMEAVVKVDDTTVGVEEGVNAGMWAVGVAKSGNLVGISEQEFKQLSGAEQQTRLTTAYHKLYAARAHAVIDTVADLPAALDNISRRLAEGVVPQLAAAF